mmetsp:Transcript_28618/g.48330  ORF Transcript_28618/g.48330 Transcript_28618/m.48330 type:complete len:97 (+) Transcript_28618:168-458(+)|eukprot:CAMPEP_0114430716 /NCGR_PEP_ID=MMETSP0103-20121206/10192_1 /TAXON_ID=37642 ORGANISM="Paraphysomonas imperforata, Strain PA2" /NCGR_SAMPLE_ID=MMETSP0103 /ASSEMBLY_ACC=CAM_ASM_000201 /LENGTH=96 /DNA_ID=CAMNT_0001600187 /DNA_START=69 /DNA_END=359 /DNA_ORIENTATION=+
MGKNNILLAASVALLAYFSFEVIAKITLIVAALMFMLNPFPLARLISLICILVLAILNKIKKTWEEGQEEEEEAQEGAGEVFEEGGDGDGVKSHVD